MEFMPEKLVNWSDIIRGIGEVVVGSIFRMPRQLASHGDHAFNKPETTRMAQMELNYNGDGAEVV